MLPLFHKGSASTGEGKRGLSLAATWLSGSSDTASIFSICWVAGAGITLRRVRPGSFREAEVWARVGSLPGSQEVPLFLLRQPTLPSNWFKMLINELSPRKSYLCLCLCLMTSQGANG